MKSTSKRMSGFASCMMNGSVWAWKRRAVKVLRLLHQKRKSQRRTESATDRECDGQRVRRGRGSVKAQLLIHGKLSTSERPKPKQVSTTAGSGWVLNIADSQVPIVD